MHKLKRILVLLIFSILLIFTSCKNIDFNIPDFLPGGNDTEEVLPEVEHIPSKPVIPKPDNNTDKPAVPDVDNKPQGDVIIKGNKATNIKLNISVELDKVYNQKEDVALYLVAFKKLPKNYYNRTDFKRLKGSWTPQNLISCTGGRFNNREGLLPSISTYIECDIDYRGTSSRNAYRIVFSTKYDYIYYTHDHYSSFVRLYNGYIYDGVTEYV